MFFTCLLHLAGFLSTNFQSKFIIWETCSTNKCNGHFNATHIVETCMCCKCNDNFNEMQELCLRFWHRIRTAVRYLRACGRNQCWREKAKIKAIKIGFFSLFWFLALYISLSLSFDVVSQSFETGFEPSSPC